MNNKPKVLLITPTLANYWEYIKKEIEKQFNFDVVFFPEEPQSKYFRYIKYLSNDHKSQAINKYFSKILEQSSDVDYLFIIRGAHLPVFFLEELKQKNRNIKLIMYQWDSLHFNSNYHNIENFFDYKFSFDPVDCKNDASLEFMPLFYIQDFIQEKQDAETDYDLTFIGSVHSDRYQIIDHIRKNFSFNSFFYLYSTKMGFLKRKLSGGIYKNAKFNDFDYNYLSKSKIIDILNRSNCVLDINMLNQNGLTIRTFETLASGKKLLTTNKYIKEMPFFNEDIISVLDRDKLDIDLDFIADKKGVSLDLSEFSLESWVSKIFSKLIQP